MKMSLVRKFNNWMIYKVKDNDWVVKDDFQEPKENILTAIKESLMETYSISDSEASEQIQKFKQYNNKDLIDSIYNFACEYKRLVKFCTESDEIVILYDRPELIKKHLNNGIFKHTEIITEDTKNRKWFMYDMRIVDTLQGIIDRNTDSYPMYKYCDKERQQRISIDNNKLLIESINHQKETNTLLRQLIEQTKSTTLKNLNQDDYLLI